MAGITDEGPVKKTLAEIQQEIQDNWTSEIDPNLDLSDDSTLVQLFSPVYGALAELWDLWLATYYAKSSLASGQALVDISALTGTRPSDPVKTQVVGTVTMDAGKALPAGSVAHLTDQPSKRFVTLTEVPADPSGGAFQVTFESELAGAISVAIGQLSTIAVSVDGWTGVTNAAGPTVAGALTETDSELRAKRELELAASGNATIDAVTSDLIRVEGVVDALVTENLLTTSITCTVRGGTAANIAAAILASKAGGVTTQGAIVTVVQDSKNNDVTIRHNDATELVVHCNITVVVDSDEFDATDGEDNLKALIAAYVNALAMGSDVIFKKVECSVLPEPGVLDVTSCLIGFGAATETTNLSVSNSSYATCDVANITVTVT